MEFWEILIRCVVVFYITYRVIILAGNFFWDKKKNKFRWAGLYDEEKTYEKYDVVFIRDKFFYCDRRGGIAPRIQIGCKEIELDLGLTVLRKAVFKKNFSQLEAFFILLFPIGINKLNDNLTKVIELFFPQEGDIESSMKSSQSKLTDLGVTGIPTIGHIQNTQKMLDEGVFQDIDDFKILPDCIKSVFLYIAILKEMSSILSKVQLMNAMCFLVLQYTENNDVLQIDVYQKKFTILFELFEIDLPKFNEYFKGMTTNTSFRLYALWPHEETF